jgi:hypothetical protein
VTPAEALAPQPAPVHTEHSRSVIDYILAEPALPADIRALLLARREQGRERYGTELESFNGRDPLVDALQEAIDCLVYVAQACLEDEQRRGEDCDPDPRLGIVVLLAAQLSGALTGMLRVRT